MNKISSSQFTIDNYGPFNGYSGFEAFDHLNNKTKTGFKEIGRCNSKNLKLRPKLNGEAVMIFDENEKINFWIHVIDLHE
jgi:hypothetical protein